MKRDQAMSDETSTSREQTMSITGSYQHLEKNGSFLFLPKHQSYLPWLRIIYLLYCCNRKLAATFVPQGTYLSRSKDDWARTRRQFTCQLPEAPEAVLALPLVQEIVGAALEEAGPKGSGRVMQVASEDLHLGLTPTIQPKLQPDIGLPRLILRHGNSRWPGRTARKYHNPNCVGTWTVSSNFQPARPGRIQVSLLFYKIKWFSQVV